MIALWTASSLALLSNRLLSVNTGRLLSVRVPGIFSVTDEAALAALEQQAVGASEAWDTVVTNFLTPDLVTAAVERFEGRADVGYAKVGSSSASRARLVFTNPELLDSLGSAADLAAEYAVVLRVSAAFDKSGNKFGAGGSKLPNMLAGIGVEFDQLGDVLFDEGSGGNGGDSIAYISCTPEAGKSIQRLLPKSLGRSNVDATAPGFEPEGTLVEMVVRRLDKRDYK